VNDVISLHRSDGESAFTKDLVNFDYEEEISGETVTRPLCGIVVIPLQDNGIAIYMGMVVEGTSISDINICCTNNNTLLNNGLVVISPEDADGHWWYGWNSATSSNTMYWALDNGHGTYEYGSTVKTVAPKQVYPTNASFTIVRAYLEDGYWSNNIKVQVTGSTNAPGYIFTLNGQKYVAFNSNTASRAPIYKLPGDSQQINLSTSTEAYSTLKTYVVGDYCIYNELLYRCQTAVTVPEPFDETKWIITTVYNELIDQRNNIYGN
jgi:hypothetical protein